MLTNRGVKVQGLRRRRGMPRGGVVTIAALLLLTLDVLPARSQQTGDGVITGGADLLFKGGEFAELLGVTLVHLLWAALEDSAYTYYPEQESPCAEECDVAVAAAQVGTSLGYFVSPGLAVGGRIVFNSDDRHRRGGAAGGFGPEVTYYFEDGGSLTPYIGAGFLYTRTLRGRRDRFQDKGSTVLLKSGVHVRANASAGLFMQVTYHNSQRQNLIGERQARWGLGFGYSGFF